jgi:DNA-3-methyladenine glycosylase II
MTEVSPINSTTVTQTSTWQEIVDAGIQHLSAVDPIMAAVIAQVGPCTLTPNPNLFETLVDAIVSQQISVKAADAIMARLRAATPGGNLIPTALLTLDHDALRAVGLSTPKARYVRDLSERVVSGQLDLAHLPQQDDEVVIAELVKVKGIGRWTAEMMLIFALGRPNVLPVDDLGFVEGVRSAYHLAERPTPQELRERGKLWHPYRTFATWYMWGLRRLEMKNTREKTRIVSL